MTGAWQEEITLWSSQHESPFLSNAVNNLLSPFHGEHETRWEELHDLKVCGMG